LITEGTSHFIILYDVSLTAPLYPDLKIEAPVMLLNRAFLETLIVNK
jgi:hypothetical protein